jgi:hypothetical protein
MLCALLTVTGFFDGTGGFGASGFDARGGFDCCDGGCGAFVFFSELHNAERGPDATDPPLFVR